jgi:transcriptional regulator with XRE-family HTH domain
MSDHDLYRAWGTRLRDAREAAGLLQSELAARIEGVTQQKISDWEQGRRAPRDSMRPRLAAVLGVPVQDLFPYEAAAA